MDLFWKTAAGLLITAVLAALLKKQQKDMEILLTTVVCAMAAAVVLTFLEPVLEFLTELEHTANLRGDLLLILLKALGIGLTAEISGAVCTDAGNASLAKMLHLLGSAAIAYLSLPLFRSLLDCIRQILGEV